MLLKRLFWSFYATYHLRGQASYPFRSQTKIKRDQSRRVRVMVEYAYQNVPYYRDTMKKIGLYPADFCSVEDLAKLPILERSQIQSDPEYFISEKQSLDRCLQLRTSGSTGSPCMIYHDPYAIFKSMAIGYRGLSIIANAVGKKIGYRESFIGSFISSIDKVQQFRKDHALFPSGIYINKQHLSVLESPKNIILQLNSFKPDVIGSYGSYLEIMFSYLRDTGASFHRPKVITYGADMLSSPTRKLIEREFKIPVFSIYRAIEAFAIGFECEHHNGLHLNIDFYPVRIVNTEGQHLSTGESGDVIVSNLINRATVLLNYRIGDIAHILPKQCACGRSLPLLSFIEGRTDDLIELQSGKIIHPQAVYDIFTEEEQIYQYQVIQKTVTDFSVAIVASKSSDNRLTTKRILNKFHQTFGQNVKVDIAFVESIDRTVTGKIRSVISMKQKPLILFQ
ncbi:MAG: hypothetical protein A2Y97_05585 [Nitrospirae bacterium RBG_13_39_12]|nr:MAG: hypothetical protein A2Y97_05585 [Nitrospirae bacterium RBG_13_39_12]